jgi:hypothetical protein
METTIITRGTRVQIINYSPFRGLIGTIQMVDTIQVADNPYNFYQVVLEASQLTEPLWLEKDELIVIPDSSREM